MNRVVSNEERIELLVKQSGILANNARESLNRDSGVMRVLNAVIQGDTSDHNLAIAYTEAFARLGTTNEAGVGLLLDEMLRGWEYRLKAESDCEMQSSAAIAASIVNCKAYAKSWVKYLYTLGQ